MTLARSIFNGEFMKKDDVSKFKYICGLNYPPTLNADGDYKIGGFNFRGFDSVSDFEVFSENYNNIAQVIRFPMRYLYFDFDKISLTPLNVMPFINDFLIEVSKKIGRELELKYFQIHTKTKDKKITSIHLISSEYAMNNSQLDDLVCDINNEYADDCIYKKDRLFFNCYNGKVGKNVFEYDKQFNQNDYKLIWIDDARDNDATFITYNRPHCDTYITTDEPILYLIENKNKYLKKSRYWKLLMSVVKRDALMSREDFCIKTLIAPYTLNQNISEWNDENINHTQNFEDIFRKITRHQLTSKIFNQDFFNYIGTITEEQKNYFIQAENDATKVKFKVDDISFNKKTGILIVGNKARLYYYDRAISHRKASDEIFNNINRDNELTQLIEDFKNKKIINLFVKALYGVGKTHLMLNPIIKYAKSNGLTLIFLTENNTLNKQIAHKHNLASHLDEILIGTPQDYVITSVESIRKYRKYYDIVIVDECISLLAHFTSKKTFKNNTSFDCFQYMMTILNKSNQRVFCDADLSFTIYKEFFNNFKSNDEIITRISYNPYTNSIFKLWTTDFDWIHQVVKNKKRIAMPCNTSASCKAIYRDCKTNKINYLIITGDGIHLNSTTLITDTTEISKIKTNIVKILNENNIQVFAYSPSISTGFSLDEPYFHRVYAVIKTYSDGIVARGFIQMLMRSRNLIDKEYNIRLIPTKRVNPFIKIGDTKLTLEQDELNFYKNTDNLKQLYKSDIYTDTILEAKAEKLNNTQFVYIMYSYFVSYGFNVELIMECQEASKIQSAGSKIEDMYCMETSREEILDLLDFLKFDKSVRLQEIYKYIQYDNFEEAIKLLDHFVLPKSKKIRDMLLDEPQKEEAILFLTNNEICDKHTHLLYDMIRHFITADERNLTYGYFTIDFFLGFRKTISLKEFSRLYRFHDEVYSKISKMNSNKLFNTDYIKTAFDVKEFNQVMYVKSLFDKILKLVDKDNMIEFNLLNFDDNDITNFNLYKSDRTEKVFDKTTPIYSMITHANKLIKPYYGFEISLDTKPKKKTSFKRIADFVRPPFEKYKFPMNNWNNETSYINEERLELNVKRNTDELKKINKKTIPSGFMNKYGDNPNRLRVKYDKKELFSVYRDYIIKPNKKTIALCERLSPLTFETNVYSLKQEEDADIICKNVLDELVCSVVNGNDKANILTNCNIQSETKKINHLIKHNSPRYFCEEDLKLRFPKK